MNIIIQKLTSRKLWMALAGVVTGVAMAFGVDASDVQTVAGAMTALISLVTYIVVEGKVDAEDVKNTVVSIQDAVEAIEGTDSFKIGFDGGDSE